MFRLGLIMLAAVTGCQSERTDEARDLTLVPLDSMADVPIARSLPTRSDCVNQMPQRLALRGVVQREVRLGPPGYGETPAQDRRDTILVLVFPRAVPVCNDPAIDRDGPSIIQADRLQLVEHLGPQRYAAGDTIVVYGGLSRATWGWHYTPVVLHVDSIRAGLSVPPPGRRSSASRITHGHEYSNGPTARY